MPADRCITFKGKSDQRLALSMGTAADRPTIIPQFVGCHCDGIPAGMGKQSAAYPQPFLDQRRVELPRRARFGREVLLGIGHRPV